ncbi:glycosyltransferase family 2 protein [Allorhizobium sp. NPDC080224]|uniref:glycosyltransferase family 2 protein n=1 Tax=Allorhizobium sp. NPDC080224 TaxID=3390547 RepID=UPI003D092A67
MTAIPDPGLNDVGVVLIGRNEGARLLGCLASLGGLASRGVYVDSGSTDGSVEAAKQMGLTVVILPCDQPFTAARARNAGFEALVKSVPNLAFVQFLDGDCQLANNWVETARAYMVANAGLAVVCGRRREMFPEASIYNLLCDEEWNTPVGEAEACGGDCLVRCTAFLEVGGYASKLIAGEEPEMCLRMRERGWTIWRIDAEMTLHDVNIRHFHQWFKRSVRAGHAYAEISMLHRKSTKRIWSTNLQRSVVWGACIPALALIGGVIHSGLFLLLLLYPVQILRLVQRTGMTERTSYKRASLMVLGKFAEAKGVAHYATGVFFKRRKAIIEYK